MRYLTCRENFRLKQAQQLILQRRRCQAAPWWSTQLSCQPFRWPLIWQSCSWWRFGTFRNQSFPSESDSSSPERWTVFCWTARSRDEKLHRASVWWESQSPAARSDKRQMYSISRNLYAYHRTVLNYLNGANLTNTIDSTSTVAFVMVNNHIAADGEVVALEMILLVKFAVEKCI